VKNKTIPPIQVFFGPVVFPVDLCVLGGGGVGHCGGIVDESRVLWGLLGVTRLAAAWHGERLAVSGCGATSLRVPAVQK